MKIISLSGATVSPTGTSVALGMFDGVHMGHRRIITAAKNKSTELGISTSVLLFSSSPHGAPMLLPLNDRLEEIRALGVDFAYVYDFAELRDLAPEDFVKEVLTDTLHAKAAFAGYNYHFGKKASGDAEMLCTLCKASGIHCGITEEVDALGAAVSSTRIRQLLQEGDIESVNTLLTYPYYLRETVAHGKALGRKLGLPTINQKFGARLIPAHGIYYTKAVIDGVEYPAVSNVGVRPTVEQTDTANLETHILDFDGDLYGKTVTVRFYQKGREEMTFDTVDELKAAVDADCARARAYFAKEEALCIRE